MKIRFRETTESVAPGFPFRIGQVIDIDVTEVTPAMQAWLDDGRAELVTGEADRLELAAVAMPERAVLHRSKRTP